MTTIEVQMTQQQPRRDRSFSRAESTRSRGLWGQIWMALLQPGVFFRGLREADHTRQWLWAGVVILALIGFSAVRQAALSGPAAPPEFPTADLSVDPGFLDGGSGPVPSGPLPGGPPANVGGPTSVSTDWSTALLAGSNIVLGWFIQAFLLSEVSLFQGYAPRLGRNFRIAVWASLPLALMAAVQLLFIAAGGSISGAGVSGLVSSLPGYDSWMPFVRTLALSLFSHLTFFWLWSLALLYTGARRALDGRWWSSALVVIAWVLVLVIVPVLSGAISVPEDETNLIMDEAGLPPGFLESILSPEEMQSFSEIDPSAIEPDDPASAPLDEPVEAGED